MRHVPALDGLRAGAVALVIGIHLDLPLMSGGWMGVDVFFVLSGYLITRLLLAEREGTGAIRLGAFYAKRAARLYPALILMVLVAIALGVEHPATSALISLTYTQDLVWVFAGQAIDALGHTWSLAIEEHFYLLWPIVVLTVRSRRALAAVAVTGATASFAVAVFRPGPLFDYVPTGYYMPHTHAGPILVGCALALTSPLSRRAASATTWAGAGLLVTLIPVTALISRDVAFGAESLTVSISASMLIAGLTSGYVGLPGLVLTLKPIQWLGRISYGVYLFHMPVIHGLRPIIPGRRSVESVILVGITLAIAVCSYYGVERRVTDAVRGRLRVRSESHSVLWLRGLVARWRSARERACRLVAGQSDQVGIRGDQSSRGSHPGVGEVKSAISVGVISRCSRTTPVALHRV